MLVDAFEQATAAVKALLVDILRRQKVTHGEAFIGRIATEGKRTKGATHIARALFGDGLRRHHDIGRQVVARALLVRNDRTETWKLNRGARTVAREHIMRTTFMRRLTVRHRAHDRELVHDLSDVDEFLADILTRKGRLDRRIRTTVIRGSERLGIPGLVLRHATWQVNVNDRIGGRCVALDLRQFERLELHHFRQREANRPEHPDMEEVAAAEAGADRGVVALAETVHFHVGRG